MHPESQKLVYELKELTVKIDEAMAKSNSNPGYHWSYYLPFREHNRLVAVAVGLEKQLAEARNDTELLQSVIYNRWSISYNTLVGGWIVQRQEQTVGNIAKNRSLREAITLAMEKGQSETVQ